MSQCKTGVVVRLLVPLSGLTGGSYKQSLFGFPLGVQTTGSGF